MSGEPLIVRAEVTRGGIVVAQILAAPSIPAGDLVVMIEDVAIDIRWQVMEPVETRIVQG